MEKERKTSPVFIFLSWAFVSIPLIWGIAQVIAKTLIIFA